MLYENLRKNTQTATPSFHCQPHASTLGSLHLLLAPPPRHTPLAFCWVPSLFLSSGAGDSIPVRFYFF